MKIKKALLLAMVMGLLIVFPVSAQLGDSDYATFTVMNVSGAETEVTVTFIDEDGNQYGPPVLNDLGNGITNPFTLQDGGVKQVVIKLIPDTQLPSGKRYSVMITSTPGEVVAQAGLAGTGTTQFSGSYSGFEHSNGSASISIPSVAYNYFGWYSMITVQNLDTSSTNITMNISCANGATGTMVANNVPSLASHTFVLKNEIPSGFTASTVCDGSAIITSTGDSPIIAVNNQNQPATGATNTFEGSAGGSDTLYVANLSNAYFDWNSALTIRKLDPGATTVTVDYGGPSWSNSTCNLTDAIPSCKLYMPTVHGSSSGRNGAKITSDDGTKLLAVAGSTRGSSSNGVIANSPESGSGKVFTPNLTKYYFGYVSAVTCVNVSSTATTITIDYEGYPSASQISGSLNEGDSHQFLVFTNGILPNGFQGGAAVTANTGGAKIACQVGNTREVLSPSDPAGDWTVAFTAFGE